MSMISATSASIEAAATISARVEELVRNSRSENTQRAYRSDWAGFTAFCDARGLQSMPATDQTVAEYVAELGETCRASTIGRKVASISTAHKMAGYVTPCGGALVLSTLRGIRREKTVSVRKVAPVRVANLRAAFDGPAVDPADVRNRALVLIGYAGGFRRSELVALDLSDIEKAKDGLIITLRKSKTDQTGLGHRKGIPYGGNPATCPVRALLAWLELVGQTAGPVFRRIRKGGNITAERLTDKTVSDVVKSLAPAMGLDAATVGGHSMRAGFVTDAYAVGAPEAAIMATTGHRSHAVMTGYRREANLFKQNAAAMVGL
jgi:site-specific recombinase XerD